MLNYKKPFRILGSRFLSKFSTVNRDIIFILGNQRSGTTAIAAILSSFGDLKLRSDVMSLTGRELKKLHLKRISASGFVKRHTHEFSYEMIKEPWLTFFYDQIKTVFNERKNLFIIRDPRDNIRSILNRVGIAGELNEFGQMEKIPGLWKMVIDNRWMGIEAQQYIDSLSLRWNKAVNMYFAYDKSFVLAKYEDFVKDKVGYIARLANELNIQKKFDISDMVGVQFQKKGDSGISWEAFFGQENLKRIEKICQKNMIRLGYHSSRLTQ